MQGAVHHPIEFIGLTFDLGRLLSVTVRFLIAYALTYPIGYERERDDRNAGLRTFPIVAIAACGYVIIAAGALGTTANGNANVIQGLITGIGFIGGGAIVKDQQRVRGTATAAGLWATAAIGAAVGYGQLELALTLSAVTFATLRIYAKIRTRVVPVSETARSEESRPSYRGPPDSR
jgi:putative Mg2+ transporter-C (MgtC) family protein